MISDQIRRQKSRQASSQYLSPNEAPPSPSPPVPPPPSTNQKHKHKHTGSIRGLRPSSSTHSSKSHNENPPPTAAAATTLATLRRTTSLPSSFSSSKPPSSSKGTTRKNLLHRGLDFIKGKKGGSKLGSDTGKHSMNVHQLKLLENSWMQWRHANAKAQVVHKNLAAECENDLLCTRESMTRLRQSVVQKRLQLQKEKLNMKLNLILHPQTKMLEAWEKIETRHTVDVSIMKDHLHSVVCMTPLIQGAKVDLESTSIAFQHASHMVAAIESSLSSISPKGHETVLTLSELAKVVAQEKSLLEECFEHLKEISTLEIQEMDLRCSIIEMDSVIKQIQEMDLRCSIIEMDCLNERQQQQI